MEQKKSVNIFEIWESKVIPILKRVRKFFYIPILIALLLFGYSYFKESKKQPVFSAKITFMLEDDILNEPQKLGASNQLLMALSGQAPQSNKAIMVDLGVSNKLVEETLLRQTKIDGKSVILVNYYMDKMGYTKSWKNSGNQALSELSYSDTYKIGTNKEKDFWLRNFSTQIKANLKPSVMESGLIVMTFSSSDENFTKSFVENHLTTISEFYINKKVERSITLVTLAKRKRDSLLSILTGKAYGLANLQDNSFGSVMRRSHVPEMQLTRDLNIVNQQYAESVAALNAATLDMERKKPFISIVDDIRLPLDAVWPNPLNKSITFSIVSLVLGFAAVAGVILGLDILKTQKKEFEKLHQN
ncbi:MAG: hypothetical protein KG003_11435 [Bacteroidetes bacterium]|nr:hypothetical protein [Bacteroidota bacterium]